MVWLPGQWYDHRADRGIESLHVDGRLLCLHSASTEYSFT